MKNITKAMIVFLTTSVIATGAFASDAYTDARTEKARVESLEANLQSMGATVDTSVDMNGATTPLQQKAVWDAKHAQLQQEYNDLVASQSMTE